MYMGKKKRLKEIEGCRHDSRAAVVVPFPRRPRCPPSEERFLVTTDTPKKYGKNFLDATTGIQSTTL